MKVNRSYKIKTPLKVILVTVLVACCGISFAEVPPTNEIQVNSSISGQQAVTTFDLGESVISQVKNTKTNEILFQNRHDKEKGSDAIATAKELLKFEEFTRLNKEIGISNNQKTSASESKASDRVTCAYTHTSYPKTGNLSFDLSHPTYHYSCDNGGSASISVITSTFAVFQYNAP